MARLGASGDGGSKEVKAVTATTPLFSSGGTNPNLTIQQANATESGFLSANDWNIFNNKLDATEGNFITNPLAEVDTSGWNLYNNSGNTAFAYVVAQDITYTAVASGNAGNGINIDYIFHSTQSYLTPLVTVVSPTHITVAWYNGPTVSNNPTATQLKAAYDAVPGAVALATSVITGVASKLQYITGANITANGGDTAPINGTGGTPIGVTFTRNTSTPLVGIASFDLGKDAVNRQGQGVSTDFIINSLDKGNALQISFAYEGLTGIVLGSASDVRVFIYDITNAVLIPVTNTGNSIAGPINTPKMFTGQFLTNSTSVDYRLIFHISTVNAAAWDLLLDSVIVSSVLIGSAPTQVPSVVLQNEPISGAVTDHMAVMWVDGATQWVPATSVYGNDYWSMIGFATNIVGSEADIFVHGYMDGFSFGPFLGYNQYVDPANPGGLTPLPSPFTDTYVIMGKAISATAINIQVFKGIDLIVSAIATPTKGGLLTNSGANNGNGDQVLTAGPNGRFLVTNSAVTLGLNWRAIVAGDIPTLNQNTTGNAATATTATNFTGSLAGNVTGTQGATVISAATVTGKLITGYVSGAGVVAATDTILQAINKLNGNDLLLAPLASPTFTGDVNASTGNVLISTIGKTLEIKTGTNAKIGTSVLVAGTVTVANTSVTANSRIFLTSQVNGGTPGFLRITAKTVGTSFVITSSSATDTSTIAWMIIESIP